MAIAENRKYKPDWWNEPEKTAYACISSVVSALEKVHATRVQDWTINYQMYGDNLASGISVAKYFRPVAKTQGVLTYNVIRSASDTITARIAKNQPQPRFLTSGGEWKAWKKARLLNKFIQGLFYQVKAYRLGADAFKKTCVFGTDAVYLFERDDEICAEPVFVDELLVDDLEAAYGAPRQIHRKTAVDRQKLIAMFPEHKAMIEALDRVKPESGYDSQADMVWVTSSWHLPAKKPPKKASDETIYKLGGVWIISCEKCVLQREPWRKMYFPFVIMRWGRPLRGWWGTALANELRGFQVTINRRLRQLDESAEWAVPKCFVNKATTIYKGSLNSDIGGIVEWEGPIEPRVEAQRTIPQELLAHNEMLKADAFNVSGISQLSAQSKKPAGLESGEALRVYNDFESERFSMAGVEYEDWYLEFARQAIELARDLDKRLRANGKDGLVVTVPRRRSTQQIKWSEIDLEEDAYVMQMFPTSSLPNTPSGKLETLLDMNELGVIEDKNELRRLLNWPDLEAMNALSDADCDLVEWQIEQMIEDGIDHQPEPFQELTYAIKTVTAALLMVMPMTDVDDEHKDLLREYIEQAAALLEKTMPKPMPGVGGGAPAVGGALPPGPPMTGAPGAPPPMPGGVPIQ